MQLIRLSIFTKLTKFISTSRLCATLPTVTDCHLRILELKHEQMNLTEGKGTNITLDHFPKGTFPGENPYSTSFTINSKEEKHKQLYTEVYHI